MILKRVSENFSIRSNKFVACKVSDGKDVAKFLMVLNQLRIIYRFPGKKTFKCI